MVMTIANLKKELIQKISGTEDDVLLMQIKQMLDAGNDDVIIEITEELKSELLISSAEAKGGKCLTQEELDAKVSKWLQERK